MAADGGDQLGHQVHGRHARVEAEGEAVQPVLEVAARGRPIRGLLLGQRGDCAFDGGNGHPLGGGSTIALHQRLIAADR